MRVALTLLAAAMAAVPAAAQQPGVPSPGAAAAAPSPGETTGDDPRINQLIIYGDDPCPQSSTDEIIVCARLPEDERYRVPPALRQNPESPAIQSWGSRAIELSYVGRTGVGSCSTAGAGGPIGCLNQIIQQARAERASDGVNWSQMIEEAREDRMRRIDEAEREEAAEENEPR